MTILESDWLVFDFEDPLWGDELLSKLTPDCIYLISCLHVWAVLFFETRVFSVIMYLLINRVGIFDVNPFTQDQ